MSCGNHSNLFDPKVHSQRTGGLGYGLTFRPGKVGNHPGRRVWRRETETRQANCILPEVLPLQSPRGHEVADDGWVLSPTRKRLLLLPHRWRSKWGYRVWCGPFLGLLHGELLGEVIIELFENPPRAAFIFMHPLLFLHLHSVITLLVIFVYFFAYPTELYPSYMSKLRGRASSFFPSQGICTAPSVPSRPASTP